MEHTLTIEHFSIHYDSHKTELCPIQLYPSLYVEDTTLPRYFIGTTTMSAALFYQADCPELTDEDYQLSEGFQQILHRFPHTNQEQLLFTLENGYQWKHVPIYIDAKDYLIGKLLPAKFNDLQQRLKDIQQLTPVFADGLPDLDSYKRKRLFISGRYGSRELLAPEHKKNVQAIQKKLHYINELYSFAHYSYAAMTEFLPEYEITTYDAFHETYGKHIYSFTITKNDQTIPLLWPDYLYHQPENHLEFGVLDFPSKRYTAFNDWQAGEEIMIEILAEGFEDVHFKTTLKKKLSKPPQLSQPSYQSEETLTLTVTEDILKELEKQEASLEILDPKKSIWNTELLDYQISEETLLIPCRQFEHIGRYQLKINSKDYGQLLLLFALMEENNK
ncbi:hypothetical protein I6N96_07360 [Enterococcus sp. BWM-S5]|uniref:Uncharacterized protein n=1 Tax=Enterococcus larvae TaxID=2794352 RepID=A0ABS4CHQ0_9ENTE|nr:hypothetical protein [Enterococcus larvae]MBP1046097.1 hypothetical protein [Enterococcus larvae]